MTPPDWVLFLGRFHIVLLHFPIGLVLLLAVLELLARRPRTRSAAAANGFILALAAPASVATALFGWLLSRAGGYDPTLLGWHFWAGVGTAVTVCLAALLYWVDLRKTYRAVLLASAVLLVAASHFGGSLTHGSDYLVRHAPGPLRRLASLSSPAAAPTPADPVAAPAYTGLIHPVLNTYCVSCHGPEKVKGGLRLDSFDGAMKGGDNGPVVVAGNSAGSELIKRIRLPLDSDEHMPPDGKPQPTADDVALLAWWIDGGASADALPGQLPRSEVIQRVLGTRLGAAIPDSAPAAPVAATKLPNLETVLPVATQLAGELGVSIQPLSQTEPWLQCSAAGAGPGFGDAELLRLQPLFANLRWLDLSGTGITDTGAVHFASMTNLVRLYLQRTAVSDAGVAHLRGLSELTYLNLYGTAVSDASLKHLEALPTLRRLFLWQTAVSTNAALVLASNRVDATQLREWEDQIDLLQKRIRDSRFQVELGIPLLTNIPPAAINTNCPVSAKPVDPTKTLNHEGRTVAFCCDDCRSRFEKDPKPYLPKLEAAPSPAR